MPSLDKSKPYGEVYGVHRARFEQDGQLFDAQGNELADDEAASPVRDMAMESGADYIDIADAQIAVINEPAAPRRGRKPKEA